ncbi:MAG: sensor histidine kinase [Pelatocladus maniniholoensis HA4357-MV3]|uniref:histidine kinase n=1 Tax=Pelatocladus maniniholoensis HA4357-MV3 TaxID=1117104 RepID=A0A9E3HE14_9NOST|nr:sensor histidine kinase [Pelatocladus maniniholoensis HA4357-MV3]BAZ67371.1 histidine kinase [Fischerella sp. NIES-4106]
MAQEHYSEIPPPLLLNGSDRDLDLESTLQELQLYNFQVETSCTGTEIAKVFEKNPLLPGVILVEQGNYTGMISQRRLLEFFIRPYGQELFLSQPLSVIYSYARTPTLILPETTPILAAMQLALRRSPELLAEPVVVQTVDDTYTLLDVQQLNIASWQIRGIETQVRYERSQAQMIQNDKMANLGRLVDGIAHEILDPVGFIWGNLTYVSNYSQDLLKLIAAYESKLSSPCEEINSLKQEIEFDFLEQDLLQALTSIRTGAERLKKLVISLQNFCHIDEVYPKPADLHACIDNILLIINSSIQGEIEIIRNYGRLPPISCFIGQLHQVFMNLLSHSVDLLLDEAVRHRLNPIKQANKPRIKITTEVISQESTIPEVPDSRWVAIYIQDNSLGISDKFKQEIIESFSVEKRANKETSLAVSYRIITARHGGKFNLSSEVGVGTKFTILLPLL